MEYKRHRKIIFNMLIAIMLVMMVNPVNKPCFALEGQESVWEKDLGGLVETHGVTGIDVDKFGYVYVADTAHSKILRLDPGNGDILNEWGSLGSSLGQFNFPYGVSVDENGNIYVGDTVNHRIQKWTPSDNTWSETNGKNVSESGTWSQIEYYFKAPYEAAADEDGNIYVPDPYGGRICKFNSDGVFQRQWDGLGYSSRMEPVKIDGKMYMYAVAGGGKIAIIDCMTGVLTKEDYEAWDISFDKYGNIYILNNIADVGTVYKRDKNFKILNQWTGFNRPLAITVDNDDNLYVADTNNNKIIKFAPTNKCPTISDIEDKTISKNGETEEISFTIGDAETEASTLNIEIKSSNIELVPELNENIILGGSGTDRTIKIKPVENKIGTTTITVIVSDGDRAVDDTFIVTVENDKPVAGFGYALDFDGNDDFIDLGEKDSLKLGQNFTEEAWIYVPKDIDEAFHGFLGEKGDGVDRAPSLWVFEKKKLHGGFTSTDDTWCAWESDDILTLDSWNHVAATFDGTYYKVYVNGCLVKNDNSWAGKVLKDFSVKSIGAVDNFFKGNIDEVRLWNTTLSEEIIKTWMNQHLNDKHPNKDNLIDYWKFDEDEGTVLKGTKDNNGNFVGNPAWLVSTIPMKYYVNEGSNVTIYKTSYDKNGDSLTYEVTSDPSDGTLIDNGDGTWTYSHDGSETTSDSFNYKVNDGLVGSENIAMVGIVITPVNDAPIASDVKITTVKNTEKTGTLKGNDLDGDALTYSIVSQGSKGTVEITDASTGAFKYTPKANETGEDTFTYKSNDGKEDSKIATVTVCIEKIYIVNFDSQSGSAVSSITDVTNGNTITVPTSPTRTGYIFGGWYKESGCLNVWDFENDTVTSNIILYAKWTAIDYTVTYNGNENDEGTVPTDGTTYHIGNTVTVQGNTGNLRRIGYYFAGWNTKDNGSGIDYAASAIFNIGSTNATLYAKWNINKYTLTYIAGENGSITGTANQIVNHAGDGTEVTAVPAEGYHFVSWSDGVLTASRTNTDVTGNINATATFAINEYIVTFKNHDGTILNTDTVNHGSGATAPVEPTRTGYTFTGWGEDFTIVTEDLTVIAQYRGKKHKEKPTETSIVLVNGQEKKAGTVNITVKDGEKTVELRTDSDELNQMIDQVLKENETNGRTEENLIVVPIADSNANQIKSFLTGDIVKKMEHNDFSLEIDTENVDYIIPAKEIGIEQVVSILDIKSDSLKEIEVEVQIKKINGTQEKEIVENAKIKGYEILFPPVEFSIVAKIEVKFGKERKITISKFTSYVSRVMEVPVGIDPNKITTGIVYNSDGTFAHIPTTVFKKDGKWFAKLNSLTNSSYSVIWNPITVVSVEKHWSKEIVNDMASRLIIKNPETFVPDEFITRGDFAEYITKALGLYRAGVAEAEKFTDVDLSSELSDAIIIAAEYGIINGYPDGTFRPNAQISREEAMTMYARAMDIAGLKEVDNNRISNYTDKEQIATWAYESVKKTVSKGIFNGRSENIIAPKGTFTYAEAATAIRNLLIKAKLINE